MYKLQNKTTAPAIKPILFNQIKKLNNKLSFKQKQYISDFIKNNEIRVMQCIVKKYEIKPQPETEDNEYLNILNIPFLPNGVFIFNLTDAVILKKNGTEPWDMVFNNRKLPQKYQNKQFIPIFSSSGHVDYWDIPIPTYDDLFYVLGTNLNFDPDKIITAWSKKTINKAIFRGSPTGCGYTTQTNMRLKITTINSPFIDAGITAKNKYTINSNSIRFDPIYGIGMLNTNIKPASFVLMEEQSLYKYIIYIDGNVHAYRLLTILTLGSLILRVMSPYTSWIDTVLEPNVHYLPINPDLSNLLQVIDWCQKNDTKCKQIANNGRLFAKKVLTIKYIETIFHDLLWFSIKHHPQKSTRIKKTKKRCPAGYLSDPQDPDYCLKK
jgi:hypothetical protein